MAPPKKRSRSASGNWITVLQAAKLAGLSHFTLYKLKSTGKIGATMKKISGVMHFDRGEFLDWLKSRKKGRKAGTRRVVARRGRRPGRRIRRRRAAARVVRRASRMARGRAAAMVLPTNGATNLDFWFRILRFVRSRAGRVTIKTDGMQATLVAG